MVRALRGRYPALTEGDAALDPTRLTLCVADGYRVEAELQRRNLWPEMADRGHVVCILTGSDTEKSGGWRRLWMNWAWRERNGPSPLPPPLLPRAPVPPAGAAGPRETVPLAWPRDG